MPQFPAIDPLTLAQAIKNFLRQRQNVSAINNGGSADYGTVVDAWAEALTSVQNPSYDYIEQNIQTLYSLIQGGPSSIPTLLFNSASPLTAGQWVYQVSSDTVDAVDFSSLSFGPAIGVVVSSPTVSTVSVQNIGSFLYNIGMGFPFLPLTPDSLYYVGAGGEITSSPSPLPGGFVQEIGYAKTQFELVLNIQEPTTV